MTKKTAFLLTLVILFSMAVRLYDFNLPFIRDFSSNGTHLGHLALSHRIYTFPVTKGIPLETTGPLEYYGNYREYYSVDHPPLTPLFIYFAYCLFGVDNWVVRLVPYLFFTLSIVLLFWIGKVLLGETEALIAAALASIVPMGSYYSLETIHLAPVLFFMLSAVLLYIRWWETQSRRLYAVFIGILCVGLLCDWQAYYIAPLIFFHFVVTTPRDMKKIWGALAPILINIAVFSLYLAFIYFVLDPQAHAPFHRILAKLTQATGGRPSFVDFFASESTELLKHFTVGLLLLSFWGIFLLFRDRAIVPYKKAFIFSLAFLCLDEILFIPYTFRHNYLTFTLLPFLTIPAGYAVGAAIKKTGRVSFRAIVCYLIIFLLVAQSAFFYLRRYSQKMGYPLQYELAMVIRDNTTFTDRAYTTVPFFNYYISFYAPRFVTLVRDTDTADETVEDPRSVLDKLKSGSNHHLIFIAIHENDIKDSRIYSAVRGESESPANADEDLKSFGIEITGEESELFTYLTAHYPCEKQDGFTVFFLNKEL